MNTDFQKYYPANYSLENIISVAATGADGALESFSNFGEKSIDLAAPGKSVYSTLPNNTYGFLSGTSQATAFVSGAAARLLADSREALLPQALLGELLAGSRFNKSLLGKTKFQLAMAGAAK
jgi:subtilisin family serine protease